MNKFVKLIQALYAISVRFYPREYRLEFEDELRSVFGALAQDAASQRPVALIAFCLRELRDYPISLLQTHLEKNRMSAFFRSAPVNFTLRGGLAFVALFVAYHVADFLVMGQMQTFGGDFFGINFGGEDFKMYDNTAHNFFVVLLAWLTGAVIAGTLFAAIFGERARLRWFILVGSIAALPWLIPYGIFQAISGGEKQLAVPYFGRYFIGVEERLAWVEILIGMILAIGSIMILLAALFREQARFRRFLLIGMAAWLPLLIMNEIYTFAPPEAILETQGLLLSVLLGAFLAGMLGLLLKDRRKLLWLIAAGAILYPLANYVLSPQIYAWLLAPLFSVEESFTTEQLALLTGSVAATMGLLFGLPMTLLFVWLRKNNFPHLPEQEIKRTRMIRITGQPGWLRSHLKRTDKMTVENFQHSIPVTESMFLILLSLAPGPRHGYAIAKDIQDLSNARVVLSASTLYTTIKRLLGDGLIERSGEDAELDETGHPRKTYTLTVLGRRLLASETTRLNSLVSVVKLPGVGV